MKLAKCPLCGHPGSVCATNCCYGCIPCRLTADSAKDWNRLARLARKGRMFEWLETQAKRYGDRVLTTAETLVYQARDWWRTRSKT